MPPNINPPASYVDLAVMTDQPNKAGVGLGRRIRFGHLGLEFLGEMTADQWCDALSLFRTIKDAWDYFLADLLTYGRKKFGDEFVSTKVQQLEFDLADITRATCIGEVPREARRQALTAEHHYVVALKIPESEREADRARWLELAEQHSLTPTDLRRSIEAGQVLTSEERQTSGGTGSGNIYTVHGLRFFWERWQRKTGGTKAIEKLSLEERKRVYEELKPIHDFAEQLRVSLGV